MSILVKISWITKMYFKINACKGLLDLFNIRFIVKLKFVYLLCFAQFDVKNKAISLFNHFLVPVMLKSPSPGSAFFYEAIH